MGLQVTFAHLLSENLHNLAPPPTVSLREASLDSCETLATAYPRPRGPETSPTEGRRPIPLSTDAAVGVESAHPNLTFG